MSRGRWQHIDRRGPGARPDREAAAPPPEAPAAPPAPREEAPLVRQLRALYHLRQYAACAGLVETALAEDPHLPGARRLLGMALGQLDETGAVEALRAALCEDASDPRLRAALLSAELRAGILPEVPAEPAAGPETDVAGAAAWLRAQAALRNGNPADAALLFDRAAELFRQGAPASVLAERLGTAYLGQVVSRLAAGDLEGAQRLFARLTSAPPVRLPDRTLALAREVYAVADAARGLSPAERREVLAPLADVVLELRLRVAFYDGTRPVAMHWERVGAGG
jgi:hypothetical protein